MAMRNLKPIVTVVLLLLFAGSALGDCKVLTPEEANLSAREDGMNLFFKGLIFGCILSTYVANFVWFVVKTKRWIAALLLTVLPFPFFFAIAFYAEILAGECGFGGLDANYYLIPLAILVFLLFLQPVLQNADSHQDP